MFNEEYDVGMAIKGAGQHRLIRTGMIALLAGGSLTEQDRTDAKKLVERADLALARISSRKRRRAEREADPDGYGHGV